MKKFGLSTGAVTAVKPDWSTQTLPIALSLLRPSPMIGLSLNLFLIAKKANKIVLDFVYRGL